MALSDHRYFQPVGSYERHLYLIVYLAAALAFLWLTFKTLFDAGRSAAGHWVPLAVGIGGFAFTSWCTCRLHRVRDQHARLLPTGVLYALGVLMLGTSAWMLVESASGGLPIAERFALMLTGLMTLYAAWLRRRS